MTLEHTPAFAGTEKDGRTDLFERMRGLHRDVLRNTFHDGERSSLKDVTPSLPPDAGMVLFSQSLHAAHARLREPTLSQRLWRTVIPSAREQAAAAIPEAHRHVQVASAVIDTHAGRMTRDDAEHHPAFINRMPPEQSLIMGTVAHVLHTDEDAWRPHLDDVRAKLAGGLTLSEHERKILVRLGMSQLHVISHRASDQIRDVCGHPALKPAIQNVQALRGAASKLSTLCLRLQQWELVEPCTIKKNFITDMRLFDGDWHQ